MYTHIFMYMVVEIITIIIIIRYSYLPLSESL